MSRMKWNLDLLEEVKKQHDEALISTEHVVNRVRSDLYSMTEEVWEGEDADIARDQLHELSFKEMPDTYDQIDTCNNVIQKAQKEAYESKNFCNDFPQIFRSGSIPSESDTSKCSGDLMCDEDSCEGLKSSMKAAGENAKNVRSSIESVESILASLETDFAKFDYSSYTQPIKEQTQKVAERTEMYNTAVTRYEHKTKELDHTLSSALEVATPSVVPAPLDPSCLGIGDEIHMQGGDIIDTLEAHNSIDIGGKLSDAQLENILVMLFYKKDIDLSGLSREDFEVAFLNLPEEKQKAILMEIGLNRSQIDSILESKESKRAFVDQLCDSRTKDRFNELIKNSKFAPKTTSKNSGSKGTTPSAGNAEKNSNNGATNVPNSSQNLSYDPNAPSGAERTAMELDKQFDLLCDDDDSNDEAALEAINELMESCIEKTDTAEGTSVAYDEEFIKEMMNYLNKDDLAYQLFESLVNQIEEKRNNGEKNPEIIANISGCADPDETFLFVKKRGAGVTLSLNRGPSMTVQVAADSDFNKEEVLGYAATETSVENYFLSNNTYDWDAIEEWCEASDLITKEIEYYYLADRLLEMKLDDINKFLDKAQAWDWGNTYRNQVVDLMTIYEYKAKEKSIEEGKEKYYTRALCCSQVVLSVRKEGTERFKEIKQGDEGYEEYIAYLLNENSMGDPVIDEITVYPSCPDDLINKICQDGIDDIIAPDELACLFTTGVSLIAGACLTGGWGAAFTIGMGALDYIQSRTAAKEVDNIQDLQSLALMYGVKGNLIKKSIYDKKTDSVRNSTNILVDSFDETKVGALALYYNDYYDIDVTRKVLEEAFSGENEEQIDIRNKCSERYYIPSVREEIGDIENTLKEVADYLHDDKLVADKTDPTYAEANIIIETYIEMESYLSDYCLENGITINSLEELKEKSDKDIDHDYLKELYDYTVAKISEQE